MRLHRSLIMTMACGAAESLADGALIATAAPAGASASAPAGRAADRPAGVAPTADTADTASAARTTAGPPGGPADAKAVATASTLARKTGRPVEVAANRIATTTVYALPDGAMREVVSTPTRVRKGGSWVPADADPGATGLRPGCDPADGPESALPTAVGDDPGQPALRHHARLPPLDRERHQCRGELGRRLGERRGHGQVGGWPSAARSSAARRPCPRWRAWSAAWRSAPDSTSPTSSGRADSAARPRRCATT